MRIPKTSRGTVDFDAMIEVSQPDIPPNATRVHNPMGIVVEAPAGTLYTAQGTRYSTAGGDGRQYNHDSRDGNKWNRNPMPVRPEPDIYGVVPYILPISRKLKK
jgi:hypothetical protein